MTATTSTERTYRLDDMIQLNCPSFVNTALTTEEVKPVGKRVIVKIFKSTIYANVDGVLRFATHQGPFGIAELREYEWYPVEGTERNFTRHTFRAWVLARIQDDMNGVSSEPLATF